MAVTTSTRTASTKIYLEPGDATTCLAGANVTAGHFVKVTTAGLGNHPKVIHNTAGTEHSYGVAHHTAASGAEVSVLRMGTIGVVAGEALTSGDLISAGTAGVAMKATAASQSGTTPFTVTAGSIILGVCTADTAQDDLAPVTLSL